MNSSLLGIGIQVRARLVRAEEEEALPQLREPLLSQF